MIATCERCHAELGPWEDNPCPVLKAERRWRLSVSDRAVCVLEQATGPLRVYDIIRTIRRDFHIDVADTTLQVSISADRRFCWAGKGLYGLYRHGLVPGPRSLAGVARIFLLGHGQSLELDKLEFAMKYAGYRFQAASLNNALSHDPNVHWYDIYGKWYCDVVRTPQANEALRRIQSVAPTPSEFELVTARCANTVERALVEHDRRRGGR